MDYFTDIARKRKHISNAENKRKQKPSKSDIHNTRLFLSDFGIKCNIPDFPTVSDLLRWRKEMVKKKFG